MYTNIQLNPEVIDNKDHSKVEPLTKQFQYATTDKELVEALDNSEEVSESDKSASTLQKRRSEKKSYCELR